MPPVDFDPANCAAQVFARAGAALVGRLANLRATVAGVAVVGVLTDEPVMADVGSLAAQARRWRLECLSADLPAGATVGAAVSIPAAQCVIAERADWPDTGLSTLTLERA